MLYVHKYHGLLELGLLNTFKYDFICHIYINVLTRCV